MAKQRIHAVTPPTETLFARIQDALKDNAQAVSTLLDGAHADRIQQETSRLEQSLADTKARIESCVATACETQKFLGDAMKARMETEASRIRESAEDIQELRSAVADIKAQAHAMLGANGWNR